MKSAEISALLSVLWYGADVTRVRRLRKSIRGGSRFESGAEQRLMSNDDISQRFQLGNMSHPKINRGYRSTHIISVALSLIPNADRPVCSLLLHQNTCRPQMLPKQTQAHMDTEALKFCLSQNKVLYLFTLTQFPSWERTFTSLIFKRTAAFCLLASSHPWNIRTLNTEPSSLCSLPAAMSPHTALRSTIRFNDFPPHPAVHGASHAPLRA